MNTLKIIGSFLIIVTMLAWLHRSLHPKPLDDEAMPPYAVGLVLAEQAAKTVHDNGRVVMICMPMDSVRGQAELEGFKQTLAQHKNVMLVGTNIFKRADTVVGCLTFPQFAEVMNENSNADVIVSFLGVTSFTDAQIATLPKNTPKLVVMDWNSGDVDRGMNAGLVKAAVMTRRLSALPTNHPKSPLQWFDRYYDLVTPESNASPQ